MKREDLLAGTRPEISGGRIIMSGADGFDGYDAPLRRANRSPVQVASTEHTL
jgi:hypothetical protein